MFASRACLIGKRRQRLQPPPHLPGHRRAGVDDGDVRTRQALDQLGQKRVVGAAEHQRVRALFQQWLQISLQQRAGTRPVQIAVFHAIGQAGAGLHHHPRPMAVLVEQGGEFIAAHGVAGGQDADHAGTGGGHRWLERRFDADDRCIEARAQPRDCRCRGGVARHHYRLGVLIEQVVGDQQRTLDDEFSRFAAVRGVAGIRHVQQVFVGQVSANAPQHR